MGPTQKHPSWKAISSFSIINVAMKDESWTNKLTGEEECNIVLAFGQVLVVIN